jgi:hypothetical protein
MCSTQPKAYNEVPRQPLMDALLERTQHQVARSDQVPVGDKLGDRVATAEAGPLAAPFKSEVDGCIDYWL